MENSKIMICGTPAAPFLSANNETIALKFEQVSGPSGNDGKCSLGMQLSYSCIPKLGFFNLLG